MRVDDELVAAVKGKAIIKDNIELQTYPKTKDLVY